MHTDNLKQQLIGTNAIRRLVSMEKDPPTYQIVKSGVIQTIIQFHLCGHFQIFWLDQINKLKH